MKGKDRWPKGTCQLSKTSWRLYSVGLVPWPPLVAKQNKTKPKTNPGKTNPGKSGFIAVGCYSLNRHIVKPNKNTKSGEWAGVLRKQWFLRWHPRSSNLNITWELCQNINSQAHSRSHWVKNYGSVCWERVYVEGILMGSKTKSVCNREVCETIMTLLILDLLNFYKEYVRNMLSSLF